MTRYSGPNLSGVATIDRRPIRAFAACEVCDALVGGTPGQSIAATRKAAQRHVQRTGHTVELTVDHLYVFGVQYVEHDASEG